MQADEDEQVSFEMTDANNRNPRFAYRFDIQ
jgi:hypothetical protein